MLNPFPKQRGLASLLGLTIVLMAAPGTNGSISSAPLTNNGLDPIPVSLESYFDNDGIDSVGIRDGNFDGSGYVYPAEELPAAGPITVDGILFEFPSSAPGDRNNVVALGQDIALPKGHYHGAYVLLAASYGANSGIATVHYADGSAVQAPFSAADWYGGGGPVHAPYRYGPGGTDPHPVSIWLGQIWFDPTKEPVSLTLPITNPPLPNRSSLHMFALSMQPIASGKVIVLRGAKSTSKLFPNADGAQAVEATITNLGDAWITPEDGVTVWVNTLGADTVAPANISRLAPGEEIRVRIGIRKHRDVPDGTVETAEVIAAGGGDLAGRQEAQLTLGVPDYRPSDASLGTHESPYWFDDAKFGIFIHWGVYSVPAWSPPATQYAEWYWNHMQSPSNPVYRYHAEMFGESFAYDDFIPQFQAEKFDPRSWVDLIADAGAKYFVLTSKHHEGFALFDSKVSGRNSVALGPHQDLVRSLFDASRQYQPDLRPGLYYSMPEWFNPDSPWMGHPPRNPYTFEPEPYTGYQSGRDYVHDVQAPQMLELIRQYDPDIIWCDIGRENDSRNVEAEYFNQAKNRKVPKDVTVDNRCGIPTYDFTTPEYTTYRDTVVRKWEASRGLDPRSYGYNRATPDSLYMTADAVVQTLVDITSKNGNFLLDIGPRADGTIPEIMQLRLREAGDWLAINGESIYGTTYWARMAEQGRLRFTVKPNEAFYITSFDRPGRQLTVDAPVPIRAGDEVEMLGYDGGPLTWTREDGRLVIDVPEAAAEAGSHAWVFKITGEPLATR